MKWITYRHIKTGKLYQLLAHGVDCTNSRDGTPVAIYSPQDNPHLIFAREMSEFEEKFEVLR